MVSFIFPLKTAYSLSLTRLGSAIGDLSGIKQDYLLLNSPQTASPLVTAP